MSNENNKIIIWRSISFGDIQQAGYNIEVSTDDLDPEKCKITSITKNGERISRRDLNEALVILGLKNNQHLHVEPETEHRTLGGSRYTGHRFTGEERSDEDWIKSGYASEEAYLATSKFGASMVQQAMRMQKGGDR